MSNDMIEWVGSDVITGHTRHTPMTATRAILQLIDRSEHDRKLIDKLFLEIGHLQQQIVDLRKTVSAK
jgi:hypothetical protein